MSFNKFIKQNFALCVGLGLPILLVIGFLAVSTIPKTLAAPPQYKLVYSTEQYGSSRSTSFTVSPETGANGRIYLRLTKNPNGSYVTPKIFVYDAKEKTSQEIIFTLPTSIHGQSEEIPLTEAAHLKLSRDITAPDGYAFEESSYHSAGFVMDVFGAGRSAAPRIVKGAVAYQLPDKSRYPRARFLGWVIEDNKK